MPLIAKNQDTENNLSIYISEGKILEIPAGGEIDLLDSCTRAEISQSDVPFHIEEENIILNNGSTDLTKLKALRIAFDAVAEEGPKMADGRPLVRADTRPLDTETYFTMAGDTASGIGDGAPMMWNMDEDDDWFDTGDGYKKKIFKLTFNHEIYLKDGSIYFFNAPWGAHVEFYITVPAGGYYPNEYGPIPASALGQPGDGMWAYAATDILYQCYVNKHYMHGDCPMGDELNAEGAAINGLPVGWYLMGHIHAPATASGTGFKGYASIECYREKTIVLPGDPLGDPTT
jgi:hypothetical protein